MESEMGAIRKVKSVRWKVVPPDDCDEKVRTSKVEAEATTHLSQLQLAGFAKGRKSHVLTVAWEVRIRSRLAPDLCKTFLTRKATDDWLKQQALLRALRYPGWFTERKRVVTAATLEARAKKKLQAPPKARLRDKGRHWALVSLAIETAMRRGELLKLRWTHVELDRGYVDLPKETTKSSRCRPV